MTDSARYVICDLLCAAAIALALFVGLTRVADAISHVEIFANTGPSINNSTFYAGQTEIDRTKITIGSIYYGTVTFGTGK